MTASSRERWRGSLMGVLCGDAAGAPYETMKGQEIIEDLDRRGGLILFDYIDPFKKVRQISAGHPTDDSELTAALAQSLCTEAGFTAEDIYSQLRGFIFGNDERGRRSILTTGKAYGSGGTLRSALRAETYHDSFVAFREGRARLLPTNGALMRSAPIALSSLDQKVVIERARKQSCITHIHPSSQVACIIYSIMHAHLLQGVEPREAWIQTYTTAQRLLEEERKTPDKILAEAYREFLGLNIDVAPTESEMWPHTGDVMLSLRIALWAVLATNDFVKGLSSVIRLGGDVDTYGAIAGGLLGAHFGIEGIPLEWREVLIGGEIMIDLADRLCDLAHI